METAVILGMGLVGFMLLFLKSQIKEEHWLFSNFIVMFIPLLFVLISGYASSLASGTAQEGIVTSFYTLTLWFLRIFYFYVMMAITFKALNSFDFSRLKLKKRQ